MIFKKQAPKTAPAPFVPHVVLDPKVLAEVQRLIAARQKIPAIKLVRTHTRLGLKEAKDLVDAMELGHLPGGSAHPGRSLADRARAFRDAGDHDRAVALIQAETGMSREESANFLATLS